MLPQLIPAGSLLTVPVPPPTFATVSVSRDALNVAVTFLASLITTSHVNAVPWHAPDQPANDDTPPPDCALSVTVVPAS